MLNKKTGKTEVYPFWYIEDIKNMMDYFEMKEMWHWYLVFNFGLLLGRRVGDTLNLKWSDFYYENGRVKDEMEIVEQKTEKVTRSCICGACKNAIQLYIKKTGISLMKNYDGFIFPTDAKNALERHKSSYTEEYYNKLMKKILHSQSCAYRKQFKLAAKACEIRYPVSTHSTRKSFGYWSVKLHPYDVNTVDVLQDVFAHTDRNTTLHYIGISKENKDRLFNDMGDFIENVKNGKKPIIKNSPVIPLKSEDFRELINKCYDMSQDGIDKFDVINKIIGIAENKMI